MPGQRRALLVAATLSLFPWAVHAQKAPTPATVVATVDGKPLTVADLEQERMAVAEFQDVPLEAVFEQLREHAIEATLLTRAAEQQKLRDDPEVKAELAAIVQQVEERLLRAVYLRRRLDKLVSDADLRKDYEQFRKDNPAEEEVRARHILVKDKATAERLIASLRDGADFADLAAQNTIDPTAEKGGDLGYFTRDELLEPLTAAAFATPPGTVARDPVQTDFGWHVLRVEDKRMQEQPSFEAVREMLQVRAQQKQLQKILAELSEKAKIARFDMEGRPVAGSGTP